MPNRCNALTVEIILIDNLVASKFQRKIKELRLI